MTKYKVIWVSNKTAVDFNATRCYTYGPHNLMLLEMWRQGRMQTDTAAASCATIRPAQQWESITPCSSSSNPAPHSPVLPPLQKHPLHSDPSVQARQFEKTVTYTLLSSSQALKRNYLRHSRTSSMSFPGDLVSGITYHLPSINWFFYLKFTTAYLHVKYLLLFPPSCEW